ncbi:MAG: CCA tRNA nucleotidyltransferase [Eubacteriales bacterium]|nr:CCA tRNA nucleotidyltransferase [Eubacteriales bacterium]
MMDIPIPQGARQIIRDLEEQGFEAYVVGGCVRDSLFFRTPKDWDITTDARPEEVKRIFARTIDTGIQHGTVTVLLDGGSYEVTTYRIDGLYLDGRHPSEVSFTNKLAEDLRRRDFTVNAMAYHPQRGLIDLYGGEGDLRRGVIRAVGCATERFSEDALRMLRAVRFCAQLDFSLETETRAAIRDLAPRLALVSKERIQVELFKILTGQCPHFYLWCHELGLTAGMDQALPCSDAEQLRLMEKRLRLLAERLHLEEERACDSTAVLTEDRERLYLGLAVIILPSYRGERREPEQMFRRLHIDNETRLHVTTMVANAKRELAVDPPSVRRALSQLGETDLRLVSRLQKLTGRHDDDLYQRQIALILARKEAFRIDMLAVDGYNIMERYHCRGKEIGTLLQIALEMVLEQPERNSREEIFAYLDGCAVTSLQKENEV